MHPAQHAAKRGATPPFSSIALSATDRLTAAAVVVAFLWLCVAWALDWLA